MSAKQNIVILAGEESGDLLGSALVRELLQTRKDLRVFAYGGAHMRQAGAVLLHDTVSEAVMGVTEVIRAIPRLLQLEKKILTWAITNHPVAVILIDYPGFHLRILPRLANLAPVYWFVPPKVWVWKAGRASKLEQYCRKVFTIFPFELPYFPKKGVYLGHPLLDTTQSQQSRESLLTKQGIPVNARVIALLPGSRKQEVKRHLPVLVQSAQEIRRRFPDVEFLLPMLAQLPPHLYKAAEQTGIHLVNGSSHDVMAASEFGIIASGTATLEAAILNLPMIIVYKVSWLTHLAFQYFSSVRMVGLPNLLADKEICPELLQDRFTVDEIVKHSTQWLRDKNALEQCKDNLRKVNELLGDKGVCQRVALHIAGSIAA